MPLLCTSSMSDTGEPGNRQNTHIYTHLNGSSRTVKLSQQRTATQKTEVCQYIANTNQLVRASANRVFLLHTPNSLKEIKFKEFLHLQSISKVSSL